MVKKLGYDSYVVESMACVLERNIFGLLVRKIFGYLWVCLLSHTTHNHSRFFHKSCIISAFCRTRYGVRCYPFYPRFFNPILGGLRDVEHVLTAGRL